LRSRHLYLDSNEVNWPAFNQTQYDFVTTRAPFPCLSGGFGSGKTTALAFRSIILGTNSEYFGDMSGNIILLGRLKLDNFLKTTLPELMRWLPRQWIRKHYRKDNILELWNETIYHFTHFDSVDHLQSYNVGAVGFDQMEEIPWDVFKAMGYERIRLKTLTRFDKYGNMIVPEFDENTGVCISDSDEKKNAVLNYQSAYGVCNPKGCWIYDKFYKNETYHQSTIPHIIKRYNPDYQLIMSSTYENEANLPSGYIERQQRDKSSRDFKRTVLGLWDVFEGQVFLDFTDDLIATEKIVPHPDWLLYVGIDHGGTAIDETRQTGVTAVTIMAVEKRQWDWDRVYVIDEIYLQGSTIEETVQAVIRKLIEIKTKQKEKYRDVVQDNYPFPKVRAWRGGRDMFRGIQDANESISERYMRYARMHGLAMSLANAGSNEAEGIERVNWMFRKKLVSVNPHCIHYIEAHRTVEYGKNEKIKDKQDDHSCESGIYAMSAMPIWSKNIYLPVDDESKYQNKARPSKPQEEYIDPIFGNRYQYV